MSVIQYSRKVATNRLISRNLEDGMLVLEIGATDASFKVFHTQDARWRSVDKYGEPDIRAELDGPDVHISVENRSIDMIVCTEVLEHLRMGTPLVREIARVLKPDGVAIISVPNACSLRARINTMLGSLSTMAASGDCGPPIGGSGILVDGHWVAGHVVDFNLDRLKKYLERGGLTVTDTARVPIIFMGRRKLTKITLPQPLCKPTLAEFLVVEAKPTYGV